MQYVNLKIIEILQIKIKCGILLCFVKESGIVLVIPTYICKYQQLYYNYFFHFLYYK